MRHSKSSLFLMELIIAILFFSLASTVCIQMFAKSHLLSAKTVDESHAVLQAQNLAECFLATDGDFEELAKLFPEGVRLGEAPELCLYFDAGWNACDETSGKYAARITGSPVDENNLVHAQILVCTDLKGTPKELYSLSLIHHIPQRRLS